MSTRKLRIPLLIKYDRMLQKLVMKDRLTGAEKREMERLRAIKAGLQKE